jgi:hypothetical protein
MKNEISSNNSEMNNETMALCITATNSEDATNSTDEYHQIHIDRLMRRVDLLLETDPGKYGFHLWCDLFFDLNITFRPDDPDMCNRCCDSEVYEETGLFWAEYFDKGMSGPNRNLGDPKKREGIARTLLKSLDDGEWLQRRQGPEIQSTVECLVRVMLYPEDYL